MAVLFVADVDPALEQQILHMPKAEREAHVVNVLFMDAAG
jgi:hypothetical protein